MPYKQFSKNAPLGMNEIPDLDESGLPVEGVDENGGIGAYQKLQSMILNGPEKRTGVLGRIGDVLSFLPGANAQRYGSMLKYKNLPEYTAALQNVGILSQMENTQAQRAYMDQLREDSLERARQADLDRKALAEERANQAKQIQYQQALARVPKDARPVEDTPAELSMGLKPAPELTTPPTSVNGPVSPMENVPLPGPKWVPNLQVDKPSIPAETAIKETDPKGKVIPIQTPEGSTDKYYLPSSEKLMEESKVEINPAIKDWYNESLTTNNKLYKQAMADLNLKPPVTDWTQKVTPKRAKELEDWFNRNQSRLDQRVRDLETREMENRRLARQSSAEKHQDDMYAKAFAKDWRDSVKLHDRDLNNIVADYSPGGKWEQNLLREGTVVPKAGTEAGKLFEEKRKANIINAFASRMSQLENYKAQSAMMNKQDYEPLDPEQITKLAIQMYADKFTHGKVEGGEGKKVDNFTTNSQSQPPTGKIRVRLSSGQTGTIDAKDFDSKTMEKL